MPQINALILNDIFGFDRNSTGASLVFQQQKSAMAFRVQGNVAIFG